MSRYTMTVVLEGECSEELDRVFDHLCEEEMVVDWSGSESSASRTVKIVADTKDELFRVMDRLSEEEEVLADWSDITEV